jgi:WD40 repeat protein
MQKDPSKRFDSTSQLANTLGQLLGRPASAAREGRPPRRRFLWAIPAALVSAILLALTLPLPKKPKLASPSSSKSVVDVSATPASPAAKIPDPNRGELFPNLNKIAQHRGELNDMEFTSSGRYIVSIGRTGALAVWDPAVPDKWMRRMVDEERRSEKLVAMAIIPKRSIAIVGGEGPELNVWDYDKGTLLHRLPHKHGKVRSIDISPKGDRMMTGGDIGWNMWTISPNLEFVDNGPIEEGMLLVHSVRFSTIQEVIGGVSGNGIISLKSLEYPESNKTIRVDGQVISFAFGKTRCDLAYGVDRRMITIGTSSNRLKPFSVRTLPANPLSLEYSPVRRQVAIGGDDGTVVLVDLDSGKRHIFNIGEISRILVLRYSPDGESLAIGTGAGKLFLAPLPNDRFEPPTPPKELALDRLTNQIPTQGEIRNPLKSLQSLLAPPVEDQP